MGSKEKPRQKNESRKAQLISIENHLNITETLARLRTGVEVKKNPFTDTTLMLPKIHGSEARSTFIQLIIIIYCTIPLRLVKITLFTPNPNSFSPNRPSSYVSFFKLQEFLTTPVDSFNRKGQHLEPILRLSSNKARQIQK